MTSVMTGKRVRARKAVKVNRYSKIHFYFRVIMISMILLTIFGTYFMVYTNSLVKANTAIIENKLQNEYQTRYDREALLLEYEYLFKERDARIEAYSELNRLHDEIALLEEQLEIKKEREAQLASINLNSSPYTVSNLTGDQFNIIIENLLSKYGIAPSENLLYNCGDALEQMEKTYGVNGLFVMSISWMESGSKTSTLARNHNNMTSIYGGDGLNTYSSPSECIMNTGRILKDNYYTNRGCRSASDIGKIYCPPNPNWANSITGFCNSIIRIAENLY